MAYGTVQVTYRVRNMYTVKSPMECISRRKRPFIGKYLLKNN